MTKQSLDFVKHTLEGLKQNTASVLEEGLIEDVMLMLDRKYPAHLLEDGSLDLSVEEDEAAVSNKTLLF
ncbi:hypothetical protein [Paenibacillus glycanilyticus]|uniref:Uncharacterized protein n=1 Tax=Paenibacillus glycanilyticus TaxID=126569 RepID=A0ABQ6GI93_9BACL|nr:hypothetical protein [Paenibacillus glycanilyticus]GLX70669.1 hypothetical protein MU1_50150 [Paenibacillus glycanilyticus]